MKKWAFITLAFFQLTPVSTPAQEKSVRPGINEPFKDPDHWPFYVIEAATLDLLFRVRFNQEHGTLLGAVVESAIGQGQ